MVAANDNDDGCYLLKPGPIKTRAAHSDQIYIHSHCAGIDVRTRGFLPNIQGKKKMSATSASTCKVFVVFSCFGKSFLLVRTLERSCRQEAQNELGVNEQQGRKKQFLVTTNSGQQCVQDERKWRKNHCLKSLG